MKLMFILNELFNDKNSYDFKIVSKNFYNSKNKDVFDENDPNIKYKNYRLDFNTKDNIKYDVLLNINIDKQEGRLDFIGKEKGKFTSPNAYLKKYDALKIFNTIIQIIKTFKKDFNVLIIDSDKKRIEFYKKMIEYMGLKYNIITPEKIKLYLK